MSVRYNGVVVPEGTDLADGPKAFRDLVDFGNALSIFSTAAERDAWAAPPDGAICVVLKSSGVPANSIQQYTVGTGWRPLETVPVGHISMFASATPPPNYLVCNGQAVPAGTEYDALRAVVGANVPDLRDRFVLGAGPKAMGATGGAATVTLTAEQLAPHFHNMNHDHGSTGNDTPDHGHTGTTDVRSIPHTHTQLVVASNGNQGTVRYDYDGEGPNANILPQTETAVADPAHNHPFTTGGRSTPHAHVVPAHAGNTSTNGSGQAHENMPPYYVLTFIIRAR